MKKFLSLAAITVFGALCLTACGGNKNEIVCKATENMEGMDVESKIIATLKDDKVSEIGGEMVFGSSDAATQYGAILKAAEAYLGEGSLGLEINGKNIKVKNMTALLEIMGSESDDFAVVGLSKDDFIKSFEKQGYSCK